jgi:hypothetical protein
VGVRVSPTAPQTKEGISPCSAKDIEEQEMFFNGMAVASFEVEKNGQI